MKGASRIATVAFWLVAIGLAGFVAWHNLRADVARDNPLMFGASVFLCVVAAFGVRECIRAAGGRPVVASKQASALFWVGVAVFFVLAGIMAWAVLS